MSIFLERFVLGVCVVLVGIVVVNAPDFDNIQRISLLVAAVALAVFAARTIERDRTAAAPAGPPVESSRPSVERTGGPAASPDREPTPTAEGASGRATETPAEARSSRGSLPASDREPPRLAGFVIVTPELDAREGSVTVEFLAHLIDDLAGVAGSDYSSSPTQARFTSPSGRQFADAMFTDRERTEGTPHNGRYRSVAKLPRYAEGGVWRLAYFLLVDQTGNHVYLKEPDVAALGFTTTFKLAE